MAENTEESITVSTENEMSSVPEVLLTDDGAVSPDKQENREQIDIDLDKPSTSKEASAATADEEKIEGADLLRSKSQQDAFKTDASKTDTSKTDVPTADASEIDASKTDCNGDLTETTNLDGVESSEMIESETTEFESRENSDDISIETSNESVTEYHFCPTTKQNNLNDILKIVHGDLAMEMLQHADKSATVKDSDEDNNEEEQQTVKKKDDVSTDDAAGNAIKCTTSVSVEDKRDSIESSEKTEEKLNLEIVRSPTAIGELIEEQLANNSTLSTDRTDHIVEWVKNSVLKANEESNIIEESKVEKTTNEAEKRKMCSVTPPFVSSRKSQKLVSNIIKKSIKCLNKMHAMEGAAESRRKVDTAEDDKTSRSSPSPKVPQSQQNGAALPEETAAAPAASVGRGRPKKKDESRCDTETPNDTKDKQLLASTSRQSTTTPSDIVQPRHVKAASEPVEIRKRKSTNGQLISLGNPRKKFRDNSSREEYISRIVGDNESIADLVAKADRLRADILALQNLAHDKEMEWNEILRKRKLKEEAYMRIERKIQTTFYMENDSQLSETLPATRSFLGSAEWENIANATSISKERSFGCKEDLGERSSDSSGSKKEKTRRVSSQQRATPPKTNGESNRKQNDALSPESRQIGEGRQGAIVDVRSIIADHRLKHPETVPRRGRRMRNSNVNINLGAGGAMVETGHNADSRPSSTESCKSNPSASDSMNYKDMLVQFAKISQQGESIKVPQNYPDVTLHPVTPSSAQNTSQPTSSLLHGILTKAQTPRSTTFSPTLARLLTAPERERSSPAVAAAAAAAAASASMSQQSATTQHLLQAYQGSNLVSINDLLSSSKARTEITITPVVNTPAQSHSNDLIQVEDVEEETTVIDDRDRKGNSMVGREGKQVVKDNPPSPSAPPKCQGCIIRPAQFVCAGCGNQCLLRGQHTPITVRRSPRITKPRPTFNARGPWTPGVYNGIRREISA
ncbi:uncharacterized protein LOC143898379 isoform X2 [Temnothorax americanus]|uniref:uncharacterized protein LOC143898379 isoform X2 n=1 Tax=Temnothorax americanus TaxID=1964332 RepID=UPI004068D373